jgi:hypothetical protein
MEAGAGIEPANRGFADLGLTTWLPRQTEGEELRAPRCKCKPPSRIAFVKSGSLGDSSRAMTRATLVSALMILMGEPRLHAESDFIKGVTISAHDYGEQWATPQMAQAIDELKALGANAIAIHPYAQVHGDGHLGFERGPAPEYVTRPLDWARERGLRVMLIPHIAYWGSPFLWRGEIDFPNANGWNRFFIDYKTWIVGLARVAQERGVELFCVGLEYGPSQKYVRRWREIIAAVREVYRGRITYGANWDEIENVPFWDALDEIGVLAYFPLTRAENPTDQEIAKGWEPWIERLGKLSKRYGKPVLFTEIGYNRSERCASQPWDFHHRGGPQAEEVQARCIERALTLGAAHPFLSGMFFWKWFPDSISAQPETFDLRTPRLKALFARHWRTTATSAR